MKAELCTRRKRIKQKKETDKERPSLYEISVFSIHWRDARGHNNVSLMRSHALLFKGQIELG